MHLITLTAGRAANTVAVMLYDATGLVCLVAQQAHTWLTPRIAAAQADRATERQNRRDRRETGHAFRDMAKRVGWTLDDLRALRTAFTSLPWIPESPPPAPWVSGGYVAPGLDRIFPDPPIYGLTDDEIDERIEAIATAEGVTE